MQKSASPDPAETGQKPDEIVAKTLDTWLSTIHAIGERTFGLLWLTLFESVQDAITLGLLVRIPGLLSNWVLDKEFAGLDTCWLENNVWSVSRYACFTVVLSDYALWGVLIPRILFRFYRDLKNLFKEK
ncbi:MAG: hypothetical protein AAGE59_34050 [Cyanobacteria bacterium P01_F01_bin.86]